MKKIVIIIGSKSDLKYADKVVNTLDKLSIKSIIRIASAHKVPLSCLNIINEYNKKEVIFITIAGRSNALSGLVDANTPFPVISCPPYSNSDFVDIFSSLRMPSGVAPLVVLEPENAALAAAKILGLSDKKIMKKVIDFQNLKRKTIEEDDRYIQNR